MGEVYTKVYASAIETNTLDVNPSSGEETTTLAHVYWERDGGFTGSRDWFTGAYTVTLGNEVITATGPLYNFTPEQIEQAFADGNLNVEFSNWETSFNYTVRSAWVLYVRTHTNGCVGE